MFAGYNLVAWALVAVGSACAVTAAYLQGGLVVALGAASSACMAAASVLGWTGMRG